MHELNFLPLSYRKNVTLPTVIIEPKLQQLYGGYYDITTNTIVAVEGEYIESALAHEFRHFLQHWYGKVIKVISIPETMQENYTQFIKYYFTNSWSERDALEFEHKFAKSDLNHYWLHGIMVPVVPTYCM